MIVNKHMLGFGKQTGIIDLQELVLEKMLFVSNIRLSWLEYIMDFPS
jgi:hypothetical protein